MKRLALTTLFLGGLLGTTVLAQLTPAAVTIEDAYMPFGAAAMNSFALFPVIPDVGVSPDAPSTSFHLQWEVDAYADGIAELRNAGISYHAFFQWSDLEATDVYDVIDDDPDISDPLFGVQIQLDGTPNEFAPGKYYRSMNRVAWRNFFLKCVRRAMNAGASGMAIDNAGTLHLDSFDPEDLSAFLDYMLDRYDGATLNAAGWDYQTTDYRTWIHDELGYTEVPQSMDIQPGSAPYAREWIDFKIWRNRQTWEILQDSINAMAAEHGEVFQVYGNNAFLGYFGEAAIYPLLNLGNRNLPYYRGQLISEYFRFGDKYPLTGSITGLAKAAQSLGVRDVMWSPPGPAPSETAAREQRLHMVAETFAAGAIAQFSGTPPIDTYLPTFYMLQNQKSLLNSVQPTARAAVFLALATAIRQDALPSHYGAQMLLQELGVSYNVVIGGNTIDWPDEFSYDDIADYDLIVLPESPFMTANQENILLQYVTNGGKLLAFTQSAYPGYSGGLDEENQSLSVPGWQTLVGSAGLHTLGTGAAFVLEEQAAAGMENMRFFWAHRNSDDPANRAIADTIRNQAAAALPLLDVTPDIQRQTLDRKVMVFRHDTEDHTEMVVHFVNADVDPETLLHSEITDAEVAVRVPENFSGDSARVTFFKPGEPDGFGAINLPVIDNQVVITIPSLFIWTFAHVQPLASLPALALAHFSVSNAEDGYRLQYNTAPMFTWDYATGTADGAEIQIWSNANFSGNPVYTSGNLLPAGNSFAVTGWVPEEGHTYIARIRVWQTDGPVSDWLSTALHANARPGAPHSPRIWDSVAEVFYDGLFAGTIVDAHPIMEFGFGGDPENDSLRYILEIWTDSLRNNMSDSSNLYFVHEEPTGILYPVNGWGDATTDTLNAELDIDNYGMWFRWRSFDGLDTSAASSWGRFTWDHRNDPPNPFNLTDPPAGAIVNNPVTFSWEFTGDSDPSSFWLSGADLYLADDPEFTLNPVILQNLGEEVNQNPHATYDQLALHHEYFWKILVHDQNGGSAFSNQIGVIYTDDGSNQAPPLPAIIASPPTLAPDQALEWHSVDDPEGDPVYYELQIATAADFSDVVIARDEIFFGDGARTQTLLLSHHPTERNDVQDLPEMRSVLTFPLSDLGEAFTLLNHGVAYYWRVRAYDHFGGSPDFGTDYSSFLLNTAPQSLLPNEPLFMLEDESGIVLDNLQDRFQDADGDALSISITAWSPGLDSVFIVSAGDSSALSVQLQTDFNGSGQIVLAAQDAYAGQITDTLLLAVQAVNDPPVACELLTPVNMTIQTIVAGNLDSLVTFAWTRSTDVENDALYYHLTFGSGDTSFIDTVLEDILLSEPAVTFPNTYFNERLTAWNQAEFRGSWTVTVSDSLESIPAENGPFVLNIVSELVLSVAQELPDHFTVSPNYPNPFNPETTIQYGLPRTEQVSVIIYDVRGRQISRLQESVQEAGWYQLTWNGQNAAGQPVSAGLYLCRIVAGNETRVLKLMYLR